MNIILDSNILFSALIKDSITRKLILGYKGHFLFPSYIFDELQKHKVRLVDISGMSTDDFSILLQMLLSKVMIIPSEIIRGHKEEAYNLVKDIDPEDVIFIACALAFPHSILWSEDKRLKRQGKVKVMNTKEMMNILIL